MPLIIPGNRQASTGYTIDQSIRFNDDDNAYLSRTISSTSSTTTNTISMWVKRGNLGNSRSGSGSDAFGQTLFQSGRNASNFFEVNFGGTTAGGIGTSENALRISSTTGDSIIMKLNTTAIFRDPSAWYHIVAVVDTTNSISTERLRLYVNGNRQTDFTSTTFPSKDTETELFRNTSNVLSVGAWVNPSESVRFFDGYIAEITVINGQALDPSSFGLYNDSNIWIPKDVSGLTFGTNGFHIDGRDSSDLGDDESGNGNDFTTSGLASHDQVSDSPTNNFAVANPLHATYYMGSATFAEGNLQFNMGSSVGALSSIAVSSGKWYAEFEIHGSGSPAFYALGIYGDEPLATTTYVGQAPNSYGYYAYNGTYYVNNVGYSYGDAFVAGDIIGIALDLDNNKLYFSKNGTFQNSGVPTSGSTGTGAISIPSASSVPLGQYFIASSNGDSTPSSQSVNYNFGQDGTFAGNVTAGGNSDGNGVGNFKYSVPSGYLALCTKNLGS